MLSTFNSELSTLNCFLSLRFLDHGLFAHDAYHAGLRDVITLAVGFEIVADFGAFGDRNVAIDNGIANVGMTSDVNMVEQDRVFQLAIAVDPHIVTHHRAFHPAAGNNGTPGHNGVQRHAHALGIREDSLHG